MSPTWRRWRRPRSSGLQGEYEQLRGALTPAVRSVLDRATSSRPRRRFPDAAAFGRALTEALGVHGGPLDDLPAIENPYKGLRAFGAADAGDFFGRRAAGRAAHRPARRPAGVARTFRRRRRPERERQVERRPRRAAPGAGERRAADVGGLVPVEMTPAAHPFEQLEAALTGVAADPPTRCSTCSWRPAAFVEPSPRSFPTTRASCCW